MGSLSSALNSMANSTVADLWRAMCRDGAGALRLSRMLTLLWAVAMAGFACLFTDTKGQVVLLGLGIAGYTYGALLGAFLLGLLVRRARERDAIIAFLATLVVMTAGVQSYALAFTWYIPPGVIVTLAVGGIVSALPIGCSDAPRYSAAMGYSLATVRLLKRALPRPVPMVITPQRSTSRMKGASLSP